MAVVEYKVSVKRSKVECSRPISMRQVEYPQLTTVTKTISWFPNIAQPDLARNPGNTVHV